MSKCTERREFKNHLEIQKGVACCLKSLSLCLSWTGKPKPYHCLFLVFLWCQFALFSNKSLQNILSVMTSECITCQPSVICIKLRKQLPVLVIQIFSMLCNINQGNNYSPLGYVIITFYLFLRDRRSQESTTSWKTMEITTALSATMFYSSRCIILCPTPHQNCSKQTIKII